VRVWSCGSTCLRYRAAVKHSTAAALRCESLSRIQIWHCCSKCLHSCCEIAGPVAAERLLWAQLGGTATGPQMLFVEGASRDGDTGDAVRRRNSARQRRMLKRARLFFHTHALPIALVLLAAVGTGMQVMLMPAVRARVYQKTPSLADIQPAAVEVADTSMLEIEQITLSDCKLSNMRKMRIRVVDLDTMLAASAERERQMAAGNADSLARMMMRNQPVDTRSLHETERSNLKKILR
jgi:hypothetical protein